MIRVRNNNPGNEAFAILSPTKVHQIPIYIGWLKYLYNPRVTLFCFCGKTPNENPRLMQLIIHITMPKIAKSTPKIASRGDVNIVLPYWQARIMLQRYRRGIPMVAQIDHTFFQSTRCFIKKIVCEIKRHEMLLVRNKILRQILQDYQPTKYQ